MMKTTCLTVLLWLCGLSLTQAQNPSDTLWKTGFKDQKINLGMILADGSPLVYSDYTLYCINPQNGAIKWQSGLYTNANMKFSYFQGTSFIEVNGQVFNPINGERLPLGDNAQTANKNRSN